MAQALPAIGALAAKGGAATAGSAGAAKAMALGKAGLANAGLAAAGKASPALAAGTGMGSMVGGGAAWGPAARQLGGLQAMSSASPAMQQTLMGQAREMVAPAKPVVEGLLSLAGANEAEVAADPLTTFKAPAFTPVQMPQYGDKALAYNLLDILRSK